MRGGVRCQLAEELLDGRLDALGEAGDGVVAPAGEDDDDRLGEQACGQGLLRAGPEVPLDPRPDDRALPHAAGPVEQRQPGGQQVGGDDPPLLLAAEEERSVGLGERRQPDVGRRRDDDPGSRRSLDGHESGEPEPFVEGCSSASVSSVTYFRSGMSNTSTPRASQSSCSISFGFL